MEMPEREPKGGASAGAYWTGILNRAMKYRESHPNGHKAWRRFTNLAKGDHWKTSRSGETDEIDSDNVREKITVNITGSTVQNMIPFLIRKRPQFLLKPRRPEDVVSVMLQQETLNYTWREFGMQAQARKAIQDCVTIGHGVIKTGFTLEVDESKNAKQGETLEYRDYVKKEEPYLQRVSPFLFFFDPESPDHSLHSARWCAEVFFKSVYDVIENERYSKKVRQQIQDGLVTPTTVDSYLKSASADSELHFSDTESKVPLDRIVLFELWDKRSGKYYVMAHGIDEPLIEEPTWPYDYLLGEFPYELVEFIPVIDEPYALGIPAFIEDQQYELNRTRTYMFQHRRRFNRKYEAVRTDMEEGEELKLVNGEDGTVIFSKTGNAVKAIEDAPIPTDQFNVEGVIKQDIRELTGADELMRGGSLPSRTTATEVNRRTSLLGLKIEDRIEQVDTFIVNVGRKVLQHIKKNYVTDKVVKLVGPKGAMWVSYTPADIQAESDMEMESVSQDRTDTNLIRQQKISVLQMLLSGLPMLQQAQVPVNIGELFRWTLEGFDDIKDAARFFPLAGAPLPPIAGEQATAGGAAPLQTSVPANSITPEQTGAEGQVSSDAFGALMGSLGG